MGATHTPLEAAMKFAQQPRADLGNGTRIGLAWMTTPKGIVWHNGGTGGYHSFIGFTTDGRHGVVVLTNTAVSVDELGFAVLDPDARLIPSREADSCCLRHRSMLMLAPEQAGPQFSS